MNFKSNLKASNIFIDLTPLVDVVFLLLVFFVITSDILPLKSLNVENPTIDKNSAPMTTQVLVVMDAQNVLYLGPKKQIIDLQSLKTSILEEISLLNKQRPGIEPTIVLSVDKRVEYGPFLRLLSVAQDCSPKVRLVYKAAEEEDYYDFLSRRNS